MMAEFATPVLSMYEMAADKRIDQDDLKTQNMDFALELTSILESDDQCQFKTLIIMYDDGKFTCSLVSTLQFADRYK